MTIMMSVTMRWSLAGAVLVVAGAGGAVFWPAGQEPVALAPGGFVEPATSAVARTPPTAEQIRAFVPASRRQFRFPAPFNTEAYRLTIPDDCGGKDCLEQEGYSFWRNINAHAGQPIVRVFVALEDTTYVTMITVDKTTGAVTKQGPIFGKPSQDKPLSYARGAGWFWSAVDPDLLYAYVTSQMIAKNVATGAETVTFDLAAPAAQKAHGGGADVKLWAAIASNDAQSWAMTVKKSVDPWNDTGCAIHHVPTNAWHFIPGPMGDCFVDKSGKYWIASVGGASPGTDLLVGTVNPWSVGETLTDPLGAPGHLDFGWGFVLGEDNWAALGQTLRLWDLSRSFKAPGQGRVVHTMVSWLGDSYSQPTWSAASAATMETVGSQIACSTSTGGRVLEAPVAREREVVCFPLDGSQRMLVVAPTLTDMKAPGGGKAYYRAPKGNLDVTGEYYFWQANMGGARLDAFLVRVPTHLLRDK